jgi:hypothetical protein
MIYTIGVTWLRCDGEQGAAQPVPEENSYLDGMCQVLSYATKKGNCSERILHLCTPVSALSMSAFAVLKMSGRRSTRGRKLCDG